MTVGEAKNIARQWVEEYKGEIDGFVGAYFVGSINFKAENEIWPDTSDIDFRIVVNSETPKDFRQRKFLYNSVLLEPIYQKLDEIETPDQILSHAAYGCHFTVPNTISDPTGHVLEIQKAVAKDFEKEKWVRKRCEHAQDWAEHILIRCIEAKQDS
jgi:hypothetical protein